MLLEGDLVRVQTRGSGPGLVILHGGGVSSREYRKLAGAMSHRFTTHLYDRRGRPDAAPLTGEETLETDVADLAAVLEHTAATRVFGHSGGAFVALQAALTLPIQQLAVYDPDVAIEGTNPPSGYLDAFQRALDAGDTVTAMLILGRNANPDELSARLPAPLQRLTLKGLLRTPVGRRIAELLPTMGPEIGRIIANEAPAATYAGIQAHTLLVTGAGSSRYFARTCDALASAIPHARRVIISRARHNAPNIAPKRFIEPHIDFFASDR